MTPSRRVRMDGQAETASRPRRRETHAAPLAPSTSQQHTLSVRISDTVRLRLERLKQLRASTTGERVSTSDVAKQLLESAREDRLEIVDLLATPTDTLLQIRRKGDAQQLLSRAEWSVLAYFVQHAVEAFSSRTPHLVSREALVVVLDAFLGVYALRTEPAPQRDAWYLGNLPLECRPGTAKRTARPDRTTPDLVRQTALEARRRLTDDTTSTAQLMPLMAGRNLSVLLEDEPLAGFDAVHRALCPFWSGLWRLAARGHYVVVHAPVRDGTSHRQTFVPPVIPSLTHGSVMLSFAREEAHDFSVLLSVPSLHDLRYPIRGYPAITEFRAMLIALASDSPKRSWNGAYFIGGVAPSTERTDPNIWFRAHDNGITVSFSEEDWHNVRALVHRAWEMPDVRIAWENLTLEYGEL